MEKVKFETEYEKSIAGDKFIEERIDSLADKKAYYTLKRILDIIISFLGIAISLIPSVIIAIIIKITSDGPIFYLQERLGQSFKPFKIIKFRTMKTGVEEKSGPVWSDEDDPRATNFGRILRKTHLDELPQFINVLKGDISIVGPRPERACFYDEFARYIDGFEQRMLVPQGITGLAQISGGHDFPPEKKIIYDLHYIKTSSLLLDLEIIVKTIVKVVCEIFS